MKYSGSTRKSFKFSLVDWYSTMENSTLYVKYSDKYVRGNASSFYSGILPLKTSIMYMKYSDRYEGNAFQKIILMSMLAVYLATLC